MSRRSRSRRLPVDHVTLPRPVSWGAGSLLLLAAAVGTLQSPAEPFGLELQAVAGLSVTSLVAALLALAALFSLRRAAFARLAARPGPVEITKFEGAEIPAPAEGTPTRPALPVADVLAEFRRTLVEMSLSTPQSIPNAPVQDSMLDDVREAAKEPSNAFATAVSVLRAVVGVRHAYRVSAQVRRREGADPYGITVHVEMRPAGPGQVTTVWGDSWPDIAERAAHVVGAFVLPRSRLTRRAPWAAWRGLAVPDRLFHEVQVARRLMQQRRYEEACASLFEALKIDPQNPYLRIQLAQAQEQMGLFMDALAGYADVVAVESWYDHRLWSRLRLVLRDDVGPAPSRLSRSPHGPEALLIARYRMVCRLVSVHELGWTWERSGHEPGEARTPDDARNRRRGHDRAELRRRLTMWLTPFFTQYAAAHGLDPSSSLEVVAGDRRSMRHFLCFVGYCEVQHLVRDYRWTSGRRRPGMQVTQTALSVVRVWAPIHLQAAQDAMVSHGSLPGARLPTWRSLHAEDIDAQVRWCFRWKPSRSRTWQESYNAACVFAVAIGASDPGEHHGLALRAVRHLEDVIASSSSGFVATHAAQWVSTGDDDLIDLRATDLFADFLDRYLPEERSRLPRPQRLLHLMVSLHSIRILRDYAEMRYRFWRSPDTAPDVIADELAREPRARDSAVAMARNDRHWRSRAVLIREAHEFTRRRSLPAFDSSFPLFGSDPSIRGYIRYRRKHAGRPAHELATEFFHDRITQRNEDWPVVVRLMRSPDDRSWTDLDESAFSAESSAAYWKKVVDHLMWMHVRPWDASVPVNGHRWGTRRIVRLVIARID